MKRLLIIMLCCCQMALFAQEKYQLRNNGFEEWEELTIGNKSGVEPKHWNSHLDNQGSWAGTARSGDQLKQSTDVRPGSTGSYSCVINPRKVLNIVWANGLVTTGRVNAGSTSATNSDNHNVTLRGEGNDDYNAPFYGRPDSLIFWAKHVNSNDSRKARVNAFIHGDFNCTDPLAGASGSANSVVGQATAEFLRGSQGWVRYAVKFDYSHPSDNPRYMLITCTTGATAGQTANANDKLFIDDIEMVYNSLTDLTVNGTTIPSFNAHTFDYDYWLCPGEAYPTINGTGGIQVFNNTAVQLIITQNQYNPSPTIRVIHAGCPDSLMLYTVNFRYPELPTPSSSNYALCGSGTINLEATANTGTCRWYDTPENGTLLYTGNSYTTPNLNATTTYYVAAYHPGNDCESATRTAVTVTVNPIPQILSVTGDARCGEGIVNLSATHNSDASTCRWYETNSSTEILATATAYSPSVTTSRSYFVSAYNATTGCESLRTEVAVTIHPAVETPIVTGDARCGEGEVTLRATVGQNGTECKWYAAIDAETPFATGETYTPSITNTTTYYVSSYNSTTGCESGRVPVTGTVNPIPAAPVVENTVRCGSGVVTLTPTVNEGVTYIWYTSTGTIIDTNDYYTVSLENTTTFKVASFIENTQCASAQISVTATVNPIPELPMVNHTERCGEGDVTLTANVGLNGNSCRWYTTAEEPTSFHTGSSYTTSITGTTTYYVSSYQSATGCESGRVAVTATMNSIPAVPVVGNQSLCGTGSATLTPENSENDITYIWYTADETLIDTIDSYYISEITGSTVYKVLSYHTNTQCKSAMVDVTITVNPVYDITLNPVTECVEYFWNDSTYRASTRVTHTFQTAQLCDSTVSFDLTINHPTSSVIYDTICKGQSYTEHGFNLPAQNTPGNVEEIITIRNVLDCDSTIYLHLHVKPTFIKYDTARVCANDLPYNFLGNDYGEGTHTITLTAANSCDSTVKLTVISLTSPYSPTIETTVSTRCGEGQVQLRVTRGSNGEGCYWYNGDGDQLYTGQTYNPTLVTTTTFYVSTYHSNGCESARIPITATINPVPANPTVYDDIRCGDGELVLKAIPGENGNSCRWYTATTGENLFLTDTIYTVTTSTQYYVTSFNTITGCESAPRISVKSTLNPAPAAPSVTTTEYCDEGEKPITPNIGTNGNMINWYNDLAGTTLLQSSLSFTTPALENNTSYYYYISSIDTNTSCESAIEEVVIDIYKNYYFENNIDTCGSYTWFGTTYTESGRYEKTDEKTIHGCDSTFVLNLIIYPEYTIPNETVMEICEGETYEFLSKTFTETTVFDTILKTENGCDSLVRLNLTVKSAPVHTLAPVVECDSYEWNGVIYTTSGTYTEKFPMGNGCDSTAILPLTINYSAPVTHFTAAVCQNERYEENGFSIDATTPGVHQYRQELLTSQACDSIVTLELTVHPNYAPDTIREMICQTAIYNFFGRELDEAGIYDTVVETQYGCDSLVVLELQISTAYETRITKSICEGNSYEFGGDFLTVSGVYRDTLPSQLGCDSIIILTLKVDPSYNNRDIYESICEEETFLFDGIYYDKDTVVTKNLRTQLGCDSIVILHLTVNPIIRNTLQEVTACESYEWNGTTYTESGNHEQRFGASNGCDSIVTLPLTISQPSITRIDTTVCDAFTWNDTTFTESTVYEKIFVTGNVCDSTVIVNVTVHFSDHLSIYDTICYGETYHKNGFDLPALMESDTFYINDLKTYFECDSSVTLYLTVNPVNVATIYDTVCRGEAYSDHGFNLPVQEVAGKFSYRLTETNETGCVDTNKLELVVNPAYYLSIDTAVCANEMPIEFNGQPIESAGQHPFSYPTSTGCDSIIMLNVTVNPIYRDTVYENTCANVPFVYDADNTFTEEGYHEIRFESASGCDSIVVLSLTVYPTYNNIVETVEICDNQTPYFWGGENRYDSGDYQFTFQSENGCDSTVTLHLTVNNYFADEDVKTVCSSALPVIYGDSTFYEAGVYKVIFTTQSGCDSIITLTLHIKESFETEFDIDVCDSYTWNDETYSTSGDYEQMFTAQNGCDSVVTLHLTIRNKVLHTFEDVACVSYTWNAETYNNSGNYSQTFEAENGCDSIVTLNLTIHQPTSSTIDDAVCQGEVYDLHGFNITATDEVGSNHYSRTISNGNAVGCDSIINLQLTVNPVYNITLDSEEACVSYTWNDSIYTETTLVTHTFTSVHGCDSTVSFSLTINQPTSSTVYGTVCQGEVYNENGFTIATDEITGLHEASRLIEGGNAVGCDSTINLQLTVNPVYDITLDPVAACISYTWNDSIYTETTWVTHTFTSVHDCDSTVSFQLTIHQPTSSIIYDEICQGEAYTGYGFNLPVFDEDGYYEEERTMINGNVNECDSTIYLRLTVHPVVTHEFEVETCESYTWNGTSYTTSDDYTQTFETSHGCDSIVTLHLTINEPSPETVIYDNVCQYETFTGHGFTLPIQITAGTSQHSLSLENSHGCDSLVTLHLTVHPVYTSSFTQNACNSYTWPVTGETYTETGTYTYESTTIHGCDSIITLNLTIRHSSPITYFYDEVCQGETFSNYGFDLAIQEAAGTFEHTLTLTNSENCDSLVILELTVNPSYFSIIRDTVVQGETYTENGFYVETDAPGIYMDTLYLSTLHDCDSTVRLILYITSGVGIETNPYNNEILLYPNPAQHKITISASAFIEQIEFYDVNGKLIRRVSEGGTKTIEYDIESYPAGFYFVKITTERGIQTKKLVIQ